MKSACCSLLVFREQWKCWIVYRGLIKCGQWGHVPTANCWPPSLADPQPTHSHATYSQHPTPTPSSPPHASSQRLLWLHICVWNALILTFQGCSELQRPLLGKTLLSTLTGRSCNLLDTAAENSPGWIALASNNAQSHTGIHIYFFHCAVLQKVMTFWGFF